MSLPSASRVRSHLVETGLSKSSRVTGPIGASGGASPWLERVQPARTPASKKRAPAYSGEGCANGSTSPPLTSSNAEAAEDGAKRRPQAGGGRRPPLMS